MSTTNPMNERLRTIQANISEQINQDLVGLHAVEHYPTHSADDDDDKRKGFKKCIAELREIRNRIEHIFTGAEA
jgi:hypothetical protein